MLETELTPSNILEQEPTTEFPLEKPEPPGRRPVAITLLIFSLFSILVLLGFLYYFAPATLENLVGNPGSRITTESSVSPSISPSQIPVKPETVLLEYRDEKYGFAVQYPEPESEYNKKILPVKQYLDNDLSEGYRLTLTAAVKNLDDYFVLVVKKKSVGFTLQRAWEATKQESLINDTGLNQSTIDLRGREALLIDSLGTPYSEGKRLLVYQWIYFALNDEYYIEVHKGKSPITQQILESISFL